MCAHFSRSIANLQLFTCCFIEAENRCNDLELLFVITVPSAYSVALVVRFDIDVELIGKSSTNST